MVLARMMNRPSAHKLTPIPEETRIQRSLILERRCKSYQLFDSRLESAARSEFLVRNPRKRVVHTINPTRNHHNHFQCGTYREMDGRYSKDVNWIKYHSAIDVFVSGRAIVIRCTGRNKKQKRLELPDGFSFRTTTSTEDYRIYQVYLHRLDCDPQNGLIAKFDADRLWDDDAQKNIDRLCADAIGGAA